MKILPYVLMAAGLLIVLLPKAIEWQADRLEKQLLQAAEQRIAAGGEEAPDSRTAAAYDRLSRLFVQGASGGLTDQAFAGQPNAEAAQPAQTPEAEAEPPMAILKIDKINLKLPVLKGATQENMNFAAAYMTETSPLGEIGNAAIAAHRVKTKGRLFNRLDELEAGDKIVVETKGHSIAYTVFRTLLVEPTDTSVLNATKKDSVLTLITCDPIINPTHRLIVQAKQS